MNGVLATVPVSEHSEDLSQSHIVSRCNQANPVFIATSLASVQASLKLVTDAYRQQGYTDAPVGTLYFDPRLLSEFGTILALRSGSNINGTLSMLKHSVFGLPGTAVFPEKIEELICQGKRVAELTHFAIAHESDKASLIRPIPLVHQAILLAKQQGVDTLISIVNPKHLQFWRDVMGASVLCSELPCPHVKGNPGVFLSLDISASLDSLGKVSHLMTRMLKRETVVPERDRDFPLTNEEIRNLLDQAPKVRDAWKTKIVDGIPEPLRHVLASTPNGE